jgi:hypothetical protein
MGTTVIDRKQRRPTLQLRPKRSTRLCNFVAYRQEDGVFIYRQVGQERE